MSTTTITVKTWKCLLLVCIIPFMVACSKSKFSAVKTAPATNVEEEQVDNPSPDTDDEDDDYDDGGSDYDCKKDRKNPCKPPPKVCNAGYEYNGKGQCIPKCEFGRDNNGHCKPCPVPPKPTCRRGEVLDAYGNCKPIKVDCPRGYEEDLYGKCKPIKEECPRGYEEDRYGKCKPVKPVCESGNIYNGKCYPVCPGKFQGGKCYPPVTDCPSKKYNENGSCQQCPGGCEKPPELCKDYPINIPEYKDSKELYVWIVMDGSKSNSLERPTQVAALADMYVRTIGRKMPIKIVVIAGHSPESEESVMNGGLFYPRGSNNPVITLDPKMTPAQRANAVARLRTKVQNMKTDNSDGVSDGGELLVANLFAALSPNNLEKAESLGVYGGGNLLNIHFIGDENDICTPGQVEDFNKITVGGKKMSREKYAYQHTCKAVKSEGKTYNLQAGSNGYSVEMMKRLKAIKASGDVKLHMTGFLYTGEHNIPGTKTTNENEIGHGMVELISGLGGKTYDLAVLGSDQAASESGASALMTHINNEAGLTQKYTLKGDIDYANYDRENTYVKVGDQDVDYTVNTKGKSIVLLNCPIEGGEGKIRFCVKKPRK